MRRRDFPAALVAGTAGLAASNSSQAQAICTPPCYPQTATEAAIGVTPMNTACVPGDVKRYGALGDGSDATDAFATARLVTGGRYFVSPGTYGISSALNVWEDEFFALDNAHLVIDSVTYDVSGAIASGWQFSVSSQRYLTIRHARIGTDLMVLSDGEVAGDSHRIFLPWDIRRDSHALLMSAASNGGTTDMLWRRSPDHLDSFGNRFAINYEENVDRWSVSFATSASGHPAFDLAVAVVGGPAAKMTFPALAPEFNQGVEFKQRAAGGYRLAITPDATRVQFRSVDSGSVSLTIKDQCIGFYGADGAAKQTVTGSKGGNMALASLISKLANLGLIVDNTT